MKKSIPMSIYN